MNTGNNAKLSQVIGNPARMTANITTLLGAAIANMPDTVIASDVLPSPLTDHD